MDHTWIDKLCDWIPGPQNFLPPDDAALANTQLKLGVTLPSDFVALCRHYGSGEFCALEWFGVKLANPFAAEFVDHQEYLHMDYTSYVDSGNENLTVSVFPNPMGLLPFAWYNRIHFTWETDGSPDDWPIVVIWDYEVGGFNEYDMSCGEFLWHFLRHEMFVNPFRKPWEPKDVYFQGAYDPLRD